jgi:hypothetical protein
VLFDQGVPVPLRRFLDGHEVSTAYELGWSALRNGELLARAEASGFNVFVTTDQSLTYQQNLLGRRLAIVVLKTTRWALIRAHAQRVAAAIDQVDTASFLQVEFD